MTNSIASILLGFLCIAGVINEAFGLRCYDCTKYFQDKDNGVPGQCSDVSGGKCGAKFEQVKECKGDEECLVSTEDDHITYHGCVARSKKEPPHNHVYCKDEDFCEAKEGHVDTAARKECADKTGGRGKGNGGATMKKSTSWILLVGVLGVLATRGFFI